jgi:hypothetical protein
MKNPFCPYKFIFGIPGKGVHSYRVLDIAIVDVIMTLIGAILLGYFFKISYYYTIPGMFLLGIFFHRLFCVRTTIDKWLFSSTMDEIMFPLPTL